MKPNDHYIRTDRFRRPLGAGIVNEETGEIRKQPASEQGVDPMFTNKFYNYNVDFIRNTEVCDPVALTCEVKSPIDDYVRHGINHVTINGEVFCDTLPAHEDKVDRYSTSDTVEGSDGFIYLDPVMANQTDDLPYDTFGLYQPRGYIAQTTFNVPVNIVDIILPGDPEYPDDTFNISEYEFSTENGNLIISEQDPSFFFEPEENTDTTNISIV